MVLPAITAMTWPWLTETIDLLASGAGLAELTMVATEVAIVDNTRAASDLHLRRLRAGAPCRH